MTYSENEGPAEAGDGVSELVGELDVIVIEPTPRNIGDAIKARDAFLSKETRQQVADDTANTVSRKDLKGNENLGFCLTR